MGANILNFSVKHAVVGTFKLKATRAGHIYNIKVKDVILDNGIIVKKGAKVKGTLDVYEQAAASSTFKGEILGVAGNGNFYVEVKELDGDLLVAQVVTIYEDYTKSCQHESNFFNEKDDIVRTYELYVGDIFELSAEGFTAIPSEGDEVVVDSVSKKLKKAGA